MDSAGGLAQLGGRRGQLGDRLVKQTRAVVLRELCPEHPKHQRQRVESLLCAVVRGERAAVRALT